MSAQPFLLYLHGFLSSPQSKKALQTIAYCEQIGLEDRICVPQMRCGPAETITELRKIVEAHKDQSVMLMGSSLGGYYATYLANEYGLPAALINPAVRPFESWETHLGEHRNYYSDEIHVVTRAHIGELRELDIPVLAVPQNFLVFLQAGDEILDYRQARDKFSSATCIVRPDGSHSYENFTSELPAIFNFLLSRIG